MSIQVPNTLYELEAMAKRLGIFNSIKGTKKNGGYKKEDLIIPIRNKILSDEYGSNIPSYLQLIQQIKSPMLSKRIEELKSDLQEEIWNDSSWDFEEKINGVRCLIIKTLEGIFFFSRECSRKTLMPIEMPVKVNFSESIKAIPDFIIDCEITSENPNTCLYLKNHGLLAVDNTQALELILVSMNSLMSRKIQESYNFKLCFNAFDCIYYSEDFIINDTLENRRTTLYSLVQDLKQIGLNIKTVAHSNTYKREFYNTCLNSGLEGCIAKRLDSVYIPDATRNSKGWIKIKHNSREYSNNLKEEDIFSLGDNTSCRDTIDAFISGFSVGKPGTLSENLIQSVNLSVFVENSEGNVELRNLGQVSHIEAGTRDFMSRNVNGIITLNPACHNAVVELDCTGSVVLRIRFDKSAQECIISEELYKTILKFK